MSMLGGALAPGFLIASPPLGDPNFDRTVVLLATHGPEGALGFVVNRLAPVKLGQLLAFAGYDGGAKDASDVLLGGPVQPSSGWILYLDPAHAEDQDGVIAVGDRLRITSSRSAFDDLARAVAESASPGRRIVLLGYSGWGAGQLEREIAVGAWLPVPLDEGIVFDVAIPDRWESAFALSGLKPADMISMRTVGEA
jgi:putative transcriptional regulator